MVLRAGAVSTKSPVSQARGDLLQTQRVGALDAVDLHTAQQINVPGSEFSVKLFNVIAGHLVRLGLVFAEEALADAVTSFEQGPQVVQVAVRVGKNGGMVAGVR